MPENNISQLTDHLFRNESKKMVAVLTKIFGTENMETAEDVVQDTLLQAMQAWSLKGIPDNPSAWLFRVAKNKAIDIIRRNKHSVQYDFSEGEKKLLTSEYTIGPVMDQLFTESLISDDLLRMMFACCHPGISAENQVTLILKTLCSFSTAEIAKAFLTTEDTVSKRLYRAKEYFRQHKVKLEIPAAPELEASIYPVLNAIYLLFNEGYNSTHSTFLIRKDLMQESMMLCKMLTENSHTRLPEVFALMALMCFHASRNASRVSADNEMILLPMQDRSKWNKEMISQGNDYMNLAAFGGSVTTYHLEAAIAYEHCIASNFMDTNWNKILEYYEWLHRISDSPVTALNKAVAIMQVHGPARALEVVGAIPDKKKITGFYLYYSLLGEIHSRLGQADLAKINFQSALSMTKSETEQRLLRNKILAIL